MMIRPGKTIKSFHGWMLLYILLFLLVCILPFLGLLTGYENPNLEKRSLAPLPALLADGRPNLSLPRQFEDYYADHFAFRSWLISGFNHLNQTILAQSGNQKVITGDDGWLFFADTLPDYLAMPAMSPAQLRRLATVLAIQQEVLASQDIIFYFVVAPNKNSIYGDYMPDRFKPFQDKNNLELWLESTYPSEVNTIDLLDPLRRAAANNTDLLYHQTDSHWNNLGARIAYQTILAAIARQVPSFAYDDYQTASYVSRTDWQGDLAAMLYPSGVKPDMQQYFTIQPNYRTTRPMRSLEDILIQTVQTSPDIPEQGDGSAENVTRQPHPLRLLMFRDSFANALIPFLANAFAGATFSREIPYNYRAIEQEKPDVVILEIVERNLPNLLQRAPALLAPERTLPAVTAQAGYSGNGEITGSIRLNRLIAEPSDIGLKISGQMTDLQAALDAVGPIYLGLNGQDGQIRYFEAFPIDETNQATAQAVEGKMLLPAEGSAAAILDEKKSGVLGLTAFLPASSFSPGLQLVQVWYETARQWQRLDCEIDLP